MFVQFQSPPIVAKKPKKCTEKFNEYLLNTTLHGLRYTGDNKISTIERFFFVTSFFVVFIAACYYITNVWQKWSDTPIIIGLNPIATPLKDFPFPAVTICNMNQAKKRVAEQIDKDTIEYSLLQSLCDKDDNPELYDSYQGKWSTLKTFLLNISQPCHEMLLSCTFALELENCTEIFKSVLSDEGVCCTFNSVDPHFMFKIFNTDDILDHGGNDADTVPVNWTPEEGYPKDLPPKYSPRPGAGTGSHIGLSLVLNVNVDDYYCSSTSSAGFKILLHNPTETPKIVDFGFSVAPGHESRVVIVPRLNDASELIRPVSKHVRQCLFANEGNLTYFQTYSGKNCEMECESRLTEEFCGCVQYYMPRTKNDTTICSRRDTVCYEKIKREVDLAVNTTFSCSCLPSCFEFGFSRELSSTRLVSDGAFLVRNEIIQDLPPAFVQKNIAIVHIFFIESGARSLIKGELIGFTEFLSNTGGLLGLFMGFSVLSLVEIFYYLSLRPYYDHKRTRKLHSKDGNAFDVVKVKELEQEQEVVNQKQWRKRTFLQNIFNDQEKKNLSSTVYPYHE